MDDITLITRLGDRLEAESESGGDAVARARAELLRRIAAEAAAPPRRAHRRVLVAAASIGIAAVAATVLIVTPRPAPASEAASALDRAASAVVSVTPAAASGRYLEVTTTETSVAYLEDASGRLAYAYEAPTITRTWVPLDREATWTRESYTSGITRIWGGAGARAAAERDWEQSAHRGDPGSIQRARGGRFGAELGGAPATDPDLVDLDATPRDPAKLLAVLERASTLRDASSSEKALDTATVLLRTGTVPTDLQSAIYHALGLLSDLRVVGDGVVLQGRSGTALGLPSVAGRDTREIVVDETTGAYLGERTVQHTDYGSVPAGTVTDLAAVTTRSVDAVDTSER